MMGFQLPGLAELLERASVPVHVNTHEALWVSRVTGIPVGDLITHEHGDKVSVGGELLHTPGHTPGSQCFHYSTAGWSPVTLFLEGCGLLLAVIPTRCAAACDSSGLPGDPTVFPGHWYSAEPSAYRVAFQLRLSPRRSRSMANVDGR